MGKLLKWLFGLLLVVVLLLVAAVLVVPMVVDPNDYKPQIVALVKERTGRDLAIRDPLELSVFPVLALRLGGVSLSNAQGFGGEPFAKVEELDLKVGLLPLLDRRIEVATVVLRGLGLNLARDETGRNNWDDLAERAQAPAQDTDVKDADTGDGAGFALAVQGIEVEDARVVWHDRKAGQRVVMDEVRLVTGELAGGADVPVEAGLTLALDEPRLQLVFGLDGTLSVSSDFNELASDDLRLKVNAAGAGLPADGLELQMRTDFRFDQAAGSLALSDLAVSGPQIDIDGALTASGLKKDQPEVEARLALNETNLKHLLGSFGAVLETADPAAMTRLSGGLTFHMADGGAVVDPLALRLDDSEITGQVRIPSFDGPVVRASLEVDDIDVDRYLPPQAEDAAAPGQPAAAAAPGDPFAALRTFDLQATARVGKLKINNLRMTDVEATVTSKNGVLRIDPAAARLYDGSFKGLLELDARKPTPRVRARPALSGIQIGPLLADLAGEDRLVGTGEVDADITLVGLSEREIRNSLNGTLRFAFRDGAYKGINLAQLIREAKAALGMGEPPPPQPLRTDFSEMSGSARITDGVIDNRDLQAKSPLLRIGGKGTVDLPEDNVDYLITAEIVQSLEGQGGKQRDELAGVPIPVRLRGSLQQPEPSVDLEAVVKARARQEIEAHKDEIQEKAQEEVGKALQKLFGR
jgi:AsmA protein